MNITLDNIVIPSTDKVIATHFYCRIFGFKSLGKHGKHIRVKVNAAFTIDFKTSDDFNIHQFCFKVDDSAFDTILANIKREELLFGSEVEEYENGKLNSWHGGRGLFLRDPNGHIIELLTHSEL